MLSPSSVIGREESPGVTIREILSPSREKHTALEGEWQPALFLILI